MKVAHVISSLNFGGAERLVSKLLPAMSAKGISCRLISLSAVVPLKGEIERHGVSVESLDFGGTIYTIRSLREAANRLRKVVNHYQPDVVHSHLYLPDILVRLCFGRTFRLISTLHGRDQWWHESTRIRSRIKTYLDILSGRLCKVRYVAVSSDVRDAAIDRFGISERRIRVIRNGIDLAAFSPKEKFRTQEVSIVQVGRLYPEKGHLTSLRALAELRRKGLNACLVLVGDGPQAPHLKTVARDLGISEFVTFAGQTFDVHSKLCNADLFWMPSEREGLPLACVEAMAVGMPIVASSVGGIPELIQDGKSGALVPPGSWKDLAERTGYLIQNWDVARRYGDNAYEAARLRYSIEYTASEYIRAYSELVEEVW